MTPICKTLAAAALIAVAGAAPALADDLAKIKSEGVMHALTTGNDRPNVMMDASGKPVGYEVDMCNLIADKLGVKLDLGVLAWEGLLPSITSGRTQMICSGVNITPARQEVFDFSVPYSRTAIVAMVPETNTDVSGPTDIAGKIVGAPIGADGDDVVREIGGYKELKVYPGVAEQFADFVAGRIEVAIVGDKQAAEFMKSRPGIAKIVGKPYKVNLVGYPLPKGSTEMKAALDKIISDARSDGTLNAMAKTSFNLDDYDAALPPIGEDAPLKK
ncbi:substrate-binding periplasmic protein [Prosthecomicrobium pneumaticum]|uniref:ABC-type amino acid transport substrate-binding protein n=1 Tax=Prosthecomicrobium pneumaticum TaxID=81895 RepID=A0A7W9L2Q1_9HYPH|nr:ABC transporter substrate-binding protein [Prosthecomicrobium pneumaticum]MBB5753727.1 ABC-type amino acid transport substrate-binding protein [Prosthecomicrobium pneumaticum]